MNCCVNQMLLFWKCSVRLSENWNKTIHNRDPENTVTDTLPPTRQNTPAASRHAHTHDAHTPTLTELDHFIRFWEWKLSCQCFSWSSSFLWQQNSAVGWKSTPEQIVVIFCKMLSSNVSNCSAEEKLITVCPVTCRFLHQCYCINIQIIQMLWY